MSTLLSKLFNIETIPTSSCKAGEEQVGARFCTAADAFWTVNDIAWFGSTRESGDEFRDRAFCICVEGEVSSSVVKELGVETYCTVSECFAKRPQTCEVMHPAQYSRCSAQQMI